MVQRDSLCLNVAVCTRAATCARAGCQKKRKWAQSWRENPSWASVGKLIIDGYPRLMRRKHEIILATGALCGNSK